MRTKRFLLAALTVIAIVMSLSVIACAEGPAYAIKCSVSGNTDAEECVFCITPVSDNAVPFAEAHVSIVGNGDIEFILPEYPAPDIYEYELKQVPGSTSNCHYDSTVYSITIVYANDGEGGQIPIFIFHVKGEEEKITSLTFNNRYDAVETEEHSVKTGDDTNLKPYFIYGGISLVCIVGFALIIVFERKADKKKKEND